MEKLELIYDEMLDIMAVDRKKQALDMDISNYNIEKVPTFIFLTGCKRIRINNRNTLNNPRK